MNPAHPVSEFQKAWQRFRSNKPALGALWFIAAAVGIALFGYLIAPDRTPDANTQLTEIALREPGARVPLLPVPLNRPASKISWMGILLRGCPATFKMIPLATDQVELIADSIHFQRIGNQNPKEK